MMDVRTHAALQQLIHLTIRSLLHYIDEAEPWTTVIDPESVGKLRTMAARERAEIQKLVGLMRKHHMPPPYLGAYAMSFTTLNFLAMPRMLALLADDQKQSLAGCEKLLLQVGSLELRGQVEHLLEVRRGHLETLEKLQTRLPAEAVQ